MPLLSGSQHHLTRRMERRKLGALAAAGKDSCIHCLCSVRPCKGVRPEVSIFFSTQLPLHIDVIVVCELDPSPIPRCKTFLSRFFFFFSFSSAPTLSPLPPAPPPSPLESNISLLTVILPFQLLPTYLIPDVLQSQTGV